MTVTNPDLDHVGVCGSTNAFVPKLNLPAKEANNNDNHNHGPSLDTALSTGSTQPTSTVLVVLCHPLTRAAYPPQIVQQANVTVVRCCVIIAKRRLPFIARPAASCEFKHIIDVLCGSDVPDYSSISQLLQGSRREESSGAANVAFSSFHSSSIN